MAATLGEVVERRAVRELPEAERPAEVQTRTMSPATIFLDDLETIAGWFREVDAATKIRTPRYEVDDVADLRDVPESEPKQVEIVAPERGIWLSLRGTSAPTLRWLDRGVDDVRRPVSAVAGHFESIQMPRWINWTVLACGLYVLFGAIAGIGRLYHDSVFWGWTFVGSAVLSAAVVAVVLARYGTTKLIREYRPSGPSRWDQNRESLANNWLVILVTLLLGIPATTVVTVVVTLLVTGY